jgi:phage terminase large subunit-like protein
VSVSVKRSDLRRVVVAIDPATTSSEDADDTGIVTVARGPCQPSTCKLTVRCPGHGYVLSDDTCHLSPIGWARVAVDAFDRWQGDRVVAEVNNGGDMVGVTLRAVRLGIPYASVNATRGKVVRAEPISALYEQGRVHHLGVFSELESEQATWTQDSPWSPNRVDALVWGLTYLGLAGAQGAAFLAVYKDEVQARKPAPGGRLAQLPHLGADAHDALRPGCAHRFFTGRCVYCGGTEREQPDPAAVRPAPPG